MMNPIVERELIGLLRTRKSLAMLSGSAVVFAVLVILRWPHDARADLAGEQSRQLFEAFSYSMLALVVLLMPVFPATSIVRETRSGTLALLLNSPTSAAAIYFGKLLGTLGFVLMLLSVSFPAAMACYVMGGLSFSEDVLMVYGVVALAALQYTTLGLLISTYARTTDSALRITYGCVFVASLLVLGPYQFARGLSEGVIWSTNLLRNVSPIPALMEILGHGDVGSQGIAAARGTPFSYLVVGSTSVLVMMFMTIRRLGYKLFDRSRSAGTITDEQALGVRAARRVFFLVDPKRRKAGIGLFTNPLMVKEFRCRRFGRIHWLLRLVAVCAVLSLTLTVATTLGTIDWGAENVGAVLVVLQVALILLITPAIASGLISAERESGGWDMLRMTPLSAGAILRGKLMSVVWTLLLVLCATLPGYAVMMWIQPVLREQVVQILICVGMTATFAVVLSAAVGSLFRRTAPAGATAYALLFLVCAGTLLIWLGRDAPFGFQTVETALRLNPLAAALSITETRGFGQYNLVPENWWLMGGASALLFLLLVVRTWRLMQPE